jgi:hypothetical protein
MELSLAVGVVVVVIVPIVVISLSLMIMAIAIDALLRFIFFVLAEAAVALRGACGGVIAPC